MNPNNKQQPEATAPQIGDAVEPADLHVGDELMFIGEGRHELARVALLKYSGERLVAFFPVGHPRANASTAIPIERIVMAWRSPKSKRD
jgi:hypothetical protein